MSEACSAGFLYPCARVIRVLSSAKEAKSHQDHRLAPNAVIMQNFGRIFGQTLG